MIRYKINLGSKIIGVVLVLSLIGNFYLFFKPKTTSYFRKTDVVVTKVIRVIDGDTLVVEGGEIVRLYEMNAPENPKDCLGLDAKNRMTELLIGKKVEVEYLGRDHFGRALAYIYLNKLLLNEIMTEEGLGYFEKGKTLTDNSTKIEQAQEKARLAERGVWSSYCQTKKLGCDIKGNFRIGDHTRIYHTQDCYNYDKITIKPGTSDHWFCTEDEAKKAGFRKSEDCPK